MISGFFGIIHKDIIQVANYFSKNTHVEGEKVWRAVSRILLAGGMIYAGKIAFTAIKITSGAVTVHLVPLALAISMYVIYRDIFILTLNAEKAALNAEKAALKQEQALDILDVNGNIPIVSHSMPQNRICLAEGTLCQSFWQVILSL